MYFRALEGAHHLLLYLVLGKITEKTGCLPPCSYIEYRILESEEILNEVDINFFFLTLKNICQGSKNKSGVVLWNTSPYMLVERESLLYSLESLVAEFGGTLGLFLGFSFMALWDGVEMLFRKLPVK